MLRETATGVVFDLDEGEAGILDEVFHGTWFKGDRRIESIKAHAALGGRLVHGCPSVPDQSGGACVPNGASMETFRAELTGLRQEWLTKLYASRAAR
ncbi:hypothetical protein [Microtetraspora glauca]|uniref:Uncharacterized protein n=1 Tax=Microtetraspora glauca TaxID=1996 RepID=A0ABV3GU72_MICGL